MANEGQKPELKPAHEVFVKELQDLFSGYEGGHMNFERFSESVRLILKLMRKIIVPKSEIFDVISALIALSGVRLGKLKSENKSSGSDFTYREIVQTIENLESRGGSDKN